VKSFTETETEASIRIKRFGKNVLYTNMFMVKDVLYTNMFMVKDVLYIHMFHTLKNINDMINKTLRGKLFLIWIMLFIH